MKHLLWLLILAPFCAHAACTPEPCLTVSWTARTINGDGSAFATGTTLTYNLYAAPQGQTLTQVAKDLTTLTTTRTNVVFGTTYCYALTAVAHVAGVASAESAQSAPVCGTPLQPIPATPAAPGNVQVAAVQAADTHAYRMRQAVDGYTWVAFGTVPPGTACDATHEADGYMLVPRASVTLANRFDAYPLLSWAKCA